MAKEDLTKDQRKVKKPAGAPQQVIVQKIEVNKRFTRTEQDIPNWRRAIQNAESQIPRRNLLYNLYADVELDGQVEAVWSKRQDAITDANWKFVDEEGKDIDEINDVIDSIGFDDLLREILNSKSWGYSIMEPVFWKDPEDGWEMDAGLIPRLFYRPEMGRVAFDVVGDEGINIREGIYAKTVMEVGGVTDLGLLMKAAPYQVLKRGGLGDYAAFIQTFGNPLIDATWDGFNEKQRQQLNDALSAMGAGGTLVRPEGTTVEMKENNTKDTGDAHGNFLRFLNNEISKALLGTTETTESSNSSGYAQSKTHEQEDERKHDTDITFVRKVLNSRFKKILRAHGFNTTGGKFVVQGEETELSKKDQYEIHIGLIKDGGLYIGDDFLYETYGIEKPEDYDKVKAEREKAPSAPLRDPNETDPEAERRSVSGAEPSRSQGKKPSAKKEKTKETEVMLSEPNESGIIAALDKKLKDYIKRLTGFFPKAPQDGAMTLTCSHPHITLAQNESFDYDGLLRRVYDSGGRIGFDAALFGHTSSTLLRGFRAGWEDGGAGLVQLSEGGLEYGTDDPGLLAAFEQNLFQFSGVKTLAELQQLNQIFKESTSFAEFYERAKQLTDTYEGWLETEYATALLTGQSVSTYHRLVRQAEIFPYWMYRTAGDHLVRPAHQSLEGIVLPYNDPRWKKLFPPNGWRCRCYVVPRMKHEVSKEDIARSRELADAYLESPQGQKETATGWGINRAESGQVFANNQQYAKKFPGKAAKSLNALKFHDYGLESYAKARRVATRPMPEYEGDGQTFYDKVPEGQLTELKAAKVLRDYRNRPLELNARNFARHSRDDQKRRAHRAGYLNAMQEALKAPDEVWLNGTGLNNMVYVKYYQGRTIIAIGRIRNGSMELKSWFALADKKESIAEYRRGLLVYRK